MKKQVVSCLLLAWFNANCFSLPLCLLSEKRFLFALDGGDREAPFFILQVSFSVRKRIPKFALNYKSSIH